MKTFRILLYFFIAESLLTIKLFAQSIEGSVICDDNPIPCNAVLLSVKDSSLLTGGFFIDGSFKLINPSDKEGLLRLSGLLFQDTLMHITYRDMTDLGKIRVRKRILDEVTIKAARESYETKHDGFSLKVSTSYLKDLGMATDVLRVAPMVIVDPADAIHVIGKESSPLILLNGREVHNIEEIKSLPASIIRTINVITEPSAKYDASVTSVIEITTKKNTLKGVSSRFDVKAGSGQRFRHAETASFSYNMEKLQLFGTYNYSYTDKLPIIEHTTEIYSFDDTSKLITKNKQHQKWINNSYIAGLNYKFNKKHELETQLSGFKYNVKTFDNWENHDFPIELYTTISTSDFMQDRLGYNVNHRMQISSNKNQLNSYFDYIENKQNSYGNIREEYDDTFKLTRNFSKNKYRIWAIKSEYTHPFEQSGFNFLMGVKMSRVKGDGNLLFDRKEKENWEKDEELSNCFSNEEKLFAYYVEFKKTIKNFNINLGGRNEYVERYASDNYQDKPIIDTNYYRFFLNFSLSSKLSENNQLTFSYINKIQRPPYWFLTQIINYLDSVRYFQGNPYLTPAYINEFVLRYTFKKKIGAVVKYQNIKDFIDISVLYDGEYLKTTYSNYDKFENWSLLLFGECSNNWMNIQSTIIFSKPRMEITQLNELVQLNKTGIYFDLSGSFTVWENGVFNCKYYNNLNSQYGAILRRDISNLSLGITQKLLKGKMIARFTADDIFDKVRYGGERFVSSISENRLENQDYRTFMLSLIYLFSNYKSHKEKSGFDDESRRLP